MDSVIRNVCEFGKQACKIRHKLKFFHRYPSYICNETLGHRRYLQGARPKYRGTHSYVKMVFVPLNTTAVFFQWLQRNTFCSFSLYFLGFRVYCVPLPPLRGRHTVLCQPSPGGKLIYGRTELAAC